jgi:mRNA interferase RelE/StbE
MAWQVRFKPSALREFQALPRQVQVRIGTRLDALAVDPRPHGVKKLEGGGDLYRIRVGDYRVVYAIDGPALVVLVVKVGHRGDVYRGR